MNRGIPGKKGLPLKGEAPRKKFFGMRLSDAEFESIFRAAERHEMNMTDFILYAVKVAEEADASSEGKE